MTDIFNENYCESCKTWGKACELCMSLVGNWHYKCKACRKGTYHEHFTNPLTKEALSFFERQKNPQGDLLDG